MVFMKAGSKLYEKIKAKVYDGVFNLADQEELSSGN